MTFRITILFQALAVACAAVCVWLGVRAYNRRERWAKWTLALAAGLPVLYLSSFGPACWLAARLPFFDARPIPLSLVAKLYYPLVSLAEEPQGIAAPVCWYVSAFPDGDAGRHRMAIVLGIEFLPTPMP